MLAFSCILARMGKNQYVSMETIEKICKKLDCTVDEIMELFSHETALFFHDLTDREPLKYTITVRTGYNPSRLQEDGFQVYTVKKDLHETGITTMQTPFGHSVPVYDMERTICDLLRSRNNIEMQVFQDALKQYARRKDKNLRTLMKYASMFHVEKILRPYLEVLL